VKQSSNFVKDNNKSILNSRRN